MRLRPLWVILAALLACQRSAPAAPAPAMAPPAPTDVTNRMEPARATPSPSISTSTSPPPAVAEAAGAEEPAAEGACANGYPKNAGEIARIAALTRCEAAARGAPGAEAGPLLVAFGRLCEEFPHGGGEGFMERRPDLFRRAEIHGWVCGAKVFEEVARRFPGSPAADDAAWELARWIGGECEGFVDCYLANGLRPLERYRKTHPEGRHLEDGVALAVESLGRNLAAFDPKAPLGNSEPFPSIVARYEEAAKALPAPLAARLLAATAPWWERLGDAPRASRVRAEAERLGSGPAPAPAPAR